MITIPVTDVDNIESADTGGSAPQRATAVVIPRGTVDVCIDLSAQLFATPELATWLRAGCVHSKRASNPAPIMAP